MPVRRIKPSHIDDWIADMSQDGVSPTKVIGAVGVLRRVLDRAVRDKALPSNPCAIRSGSLLIDASASVKHVQRHLGHQDELTTLRLYARVRPERSEDLADRLDALIAEADERTVPVVRPIAKLSEEA